MRYLFRLMLAVTLAAAVLHAEDKPAPDPRVTALAPLAVPQGFSGSLRLRGFRMKEASEIRAAGAKAPDKIDILEKKDAGAPPGMNAELAGDSEVVVDLTLAADFPPGALPLIVVVGDKGAKAIDLQVLPATEIAQEQEPNRGFREANAVEPGHSITGLINGQRDVDVFEVATAVGQTLKISVIASAVGSLLDPLVTVYDANGIQLAQSDDSTKELADASLELGPVTGGPLFITLQDAHNFGSEWHAYRLLVTAAADGGEEGGTVSFSRDVWPVLRANCISCHRPEKLKGGLDMTSFAALSRGGKHGKVLEDDVLTDAISGAEPEMPPEGEPLIAAERELIRRWIAQGAADDTPEGGLGTRQPAEPPVYRALPVIPAIAFSPDGGMLAVAGHHEVIIHRGDGSEIIGRWAGDSRRIEALEFSRDGRFLAACGGAASEFGEIQIWDVATGKLARSIRVGNDSLYGVSWSDDGSRLAVGGADKLVRAFDATTGSEVMQCDNHLDWVFGTAFVHDGSKLITVSRDRAVKLIDVASGHLIDDAARPREPVLALARHPHEDIIAYTGAEGKVRLHRMAPRGGRLKEGDDKEESAIREFEHMSTPLHAVAFSGDGSLLACGGLSGEIRIFQTDNGQRRATIPQIGGPIFAIAFDPRGARLAAAGGDGQIHIYSSEDGHAINAFPAVPLSQ